MITHSQLFKLHHRRHNPSIITCLIISEAALVVVLQTFIDACTPKFLYGLFWKLFSRSLWLEPQSDIWCNYIMVPFSLFEEALLPLKFIAFLIFVMLILTTSTFQTGTLVQHWVRIVVWPSSYMIAISLAGSILVDQDHIGVLVNGILSLHICADISALTCFLRWRNVCLDKFRISLPLDRNVTWIKFASSSGSHFEANVFKTKLAWPLASVKSIIFVWIFRRSVAERCSIRICWSYPMLLSHVCDSDIDFVSLRGLRR